MPCGQGLLFVSRHLQHLLLCFVELALRTCQLVLEVISFELDSLDDPLQPNELLVLTLLNIVESLFLLIQLSRGLHQQSVNLLECVMGRLFLHLRLRDSLHGCRNIRMQLFQLGRKLLNMVVRIGERILERLHLRLKLLDSATILPHLRVELLIARFVALCLILAFLQLHRSLVLFFSDLSEGGVQLFAFDRGFHPQVICLSEFLLSLFDHFGPSSFTAVAIHFLILLLTACSLEQSAGLSQ